MTKSKISHPKLESQNLIEAWFQPMDFKLHLTSNTPAIIQAAETSFGRFGPPPATNSPDFPFHFFEHNVDDGPPGPPIFHLEKHLLLQTTGRDSTLVADLAGGFAFGYFSPTTLANPVFFRWHFLEMALFMMLESTGLMGVHGSALVKNGRAILLRAASGGGKTTLAYAGARSRFKALAEDVVWLDPQRNLWWGMPWSFHLLPDAAQLFPELDGYSPVLQTSGEMKLEVDLEEIRPGSTTVSAQPGSVVLVKRVPGGKSQLEAVNSAVGQTEWSVAQTGLEMQLPHHETLVNSLLKQRTYRLYFGDDVDAALDLLEPLFE